MLAVMPGGGTVLAVMPAWGRHSLLHLFNRTPYEVWTLWAGAPGSRELWRGSERLDSVKVNTTSSICITTVNGTGMYIASRHVTRLASGGR